jgi:actin-related protein 8
VVDVGDQKTSISCVEDGISHPRTRVHLDYGGADVTRILLFLLRKSGCFPYKRCDPDVNRQDAQLLHGLKEEICHLDLDQCGVHDKTFTVTRPGERPVSILVLAPYRS